MLMYLILYFNRISQASRPDILSVITAKMGVNCLDQTMNVNNFLIKAA